MIRVEPQPEPEDFDRKVRQKGLSAIAEMVGEGPLIKRRGPRRINKVAESREKLKGDAFPPHWRDVLPEMLNAYNRLCAYLSLYIEHGTGNPSVDHVIPKSKAWDRVYEWSNYRLACGLMNSRKNDTDSVLDPFEIADDWFALEFVEFQVKPGPGATSDDRHKVVDTITTLKLNDRECCEARREYVEGYLGTVDDKPLPLSYVRRRAPFVARELRRQGKLRGEDLPAKETDDVSRADSDPGQPDA